MRHSIAAALADMRNQQGLSNVELSLRCGWSTSKTSRIARGLQLPSARDIQVWCDACRQPRRAGDLIAKALSAETMYVEWQRLHHHGLRHVHERTTPLYERTRTFRVYSSSVFPGMLQTEEYATGLLQMITAFQHTPDDVPEAVQARLARSGVVYRGRRNLAVLLEETVLHHLVCPPDAMAQQLHRLLAVMRRQRVSVGVLPFGIRRTVWPVESFYAFDHSQIAVENLTAEVNITTPGEIAIYLDAFARLATSALFGAAATERVRRAIRALE
ncbi:helix-turn-helix domain-containing protein [Streptomyces sp. NPDC002564]|uniref:helix-turn-helix domain-containing protein n=1 Tax=Streptomyces sp. NPDC002564 TaxID=3364649 RepID=UPI0036C73FF8